MSDSHFNTGPGWPQTREEVRSLSLAGLHEFMGMCGEEPADFDGCLSCYAYLIAQEREAAERLSIRRKWEIDEEQGAFRDPDPDPRTEFTDMLRETAGEDDHWVMTEHGGVLWGDGGGGITLFGLASSFRDPDDRRALSEAEDLMRQMLALKAAAKVAPTPRDADELDAVISELTTQARVLQRQLDSRARDLGRFTQSTLDRIKALEIERNKWRAKFVDASVARIVLENPGIDPDEVRASVLRTMEAPA